MSEVLSYIEKESLIHKMTGTTKLVFFLLWSIAAMITYDTRLLLSMFIAGLAFFKISKLTWQDIKIAVIFMAVLISINMAGIFVLAPDQGTELYGTRHVLMHLFWRYDVTAEQLFYMFNFLLKYLAVIPIALIFILATNPSEFAASLNQVGVSYKIGYAVAIALRYIPDIQRDYREISQAQQARGIDLSKKAKLFERLKNVAAILFPLVLSSINRIEVISNAMELRGFGKYKKRTWIVVRPFARRDYMAMLSAVLILALSITLILAGGSRYFNPFV
ncbi:MAG: energy-coupling factor transporter transmembrane protein EcfT [Lachnospiraceae bacterium]|nr:energy-coupling factor transporter transmembrane protein EcfT [Lachnospiraceae bacterium]